LTSTLVSKYLKIRAVEHHHTRHLSKKRYEIHEGSCSADCGDDSAELAISATIKTAKFTGTYVIVLIPADCFAEHICR